MTELRKINEITPVFGVAIQGRQNTCPLVQRDPDLRSGTPEELSKLCAEKKARAISDSEGGCRFYRKTITSDFEDVEKYCRENLPSVEEFSDYCDKRGMCPHELTKDLLSPRNGCSRAVCLFLLTIHKTKASGLDEHFRNRSYRHSG